MRRLSLLFLLVGTAVVLLVLWVLPVREQGYVLQHYTANVGELTGDVLVGQTFVAERDDLAGVGVKFATYSGRNNTQEVVFRLRRSIADTEDLRIARVHPRELGDNQFYRFDFEPVRNSGGQTYFFFVTSPESKPGDAVTVDVAADDPYPAGTAYLARGIELAAVDEAALARAGKPALDISFALHYSVPAAAAGIHTVRNVVNLFVTTWDEQRSEYGVWLLALLPAAAFIVLAVVAGRLPGKQPGTRRYISLWLLALFVCAAALRLLYAVQLPVTNDEGNYLYDAQSLLHGRLAGGDGYVKALLVVLWLSFWQFLAGPTILAGRLASIIASSLMVLPLYVIGRQLAGGTFGKRAGILAAAAWALFGAPVVTGIYAHTQPLALLFGAAGIAVLLLAVREMAPRLLGRTAAAEWWFFIGGVLLGMGAVSRKSIVSLGLIVVWLILAEGGSRRRKLRMTVLIGAGFALVLSVLLVFAYMAYGPIGISEALGINSAADGQEAVEPGQEEQVRAYSLRGMTPFFRESLPLIFLAVLGLGTVFELLLVGAMALRSAQGLGVRRAVWEQRAAVAAAWIAPAWFFRWCWNFFAEYEGGSVMAWGMKSWWSWAAAALFIAVGVFRLRAPLTGLSQRLVLSAAAVPLLWLAGMAFLYVNWIKFHANYLIEFLPPLAMLAGIGAAAVFGAMRSGMARTGTLPALSHAGGVRFLQAGTGVLVVAVLLWGAFISGYVTYTYPHTGTFQLGAAREAAAWAREHIPPDEPIFTGAALIPYLSGHQTVLNIAHPRWYAYTFIWQQHPERLAAFLTTREEMLEAYRQSEWFLLEKQTGFSFLMEYSEIEAGLETDWERVHGVTNGSNTLTFYQRRGL